MKEDLYKLELEFDSKMKQLKKKEESLEEDLSYFLQQTDQLKEEVYRMAEGELPAEVHTYFFQMDENSERFRRDVFEQLDQIQEERSKLKWEYDNEIDAFYKNQKKLESKAKKKSVRLSLLFF
ncbi:hypothetical protein SPADD19_00526 [Streptococcus parasanguinis]|uniref:hypothetical protein n=1 Tax=Streptococcus parasanguinis TaxID=1318 RepID=UPI000776FB67|nr:hypothetical protein [Streptococcus parasanguinis]KXT88960.1 hypothetical protein SPADD19_00526 [Streptococcus parasanguinis]